MKPLLVRFVACVVGSIPISSASAVEKPAELQERTLASGMRTRVSSHYVLLADCSSGGDLVVRVVTPAKQGKVEIEDQPVVISYPKDHAMATCNGKSIAGKAVMYQSNEGYTGKDEIQLEIFFPNGTNRKLRLLMLIK